jgi:hypothetical protein
VAGSEAPGDNRAQEPNRPERDSTSVFVIKGHYRPSAPPPQKGQPVLIASDQAWPMMGGPRTGTGEWGDLPYFMTKINTTGYPVFINACISGVQLSHAKGRVEFRLLVDDVEYDRSVQGFQNEDGVDQQRGVCLTALAALDAREHTCKIQARLSLVDYRDREAGGKLVVHGKGFRDNPAVFNGNGAVWCDFDSTSHILAFELCNPDEFGKLREALYTAVKRFGEATKEIEQAVRAELEPKLRAEIKASLLKDSEFIRQLKAAIVTPPTSSSGSPKGTEGL